MLTKHKMVVTALALLVVIVASGCWYQDGGDAAHSGFVPGEAGITAANAPTLIRTWTNATVDPSTAPVVGGSTVYAAGPGGVTAYDTADGTVRWNTFGPHPDYGPMSFGNPTLDATGLVVPYANIGGGGYATFNTTTGDSWTEGGFHQFAATTKASRSDASASTLGSFGSGGPSATQLRYGTKSTYVSCCDLSSSGPTDPAIVGRFVVIGVGTTVRAYGLDTCAPATGPGDCGPDWTTDLGAKVSAPVGIDGTRVAVTLATGDFEVLDLATGAVQWTGDVPSAGATQVANGAGILFVGGSDGTVYAFSKSGCASSPCAPLWSVATGSAAISHQPVAAAYVVVVGTADGHLVALRASCPASTCAPLWTGAVSDADAPGSVRGIAWEDGALYATVFNGTTGSIARFQLP